MFSSVNNVFGYIYNNVGTDIIVKANSDSVTEAAEEIVPWSSEAMGAVYAHSLDYKGEGVNIAYLDSGLDIYSEINICGSVDFEDPEYCRGDDLSGHGSAVAGVIAAPENNSGIVGIAPEASIYNLRVLDSENEAPVSRIIDALDWCLSNDIDIINMSFGTDDYSPALWSKINEVYQHGIIMISSAGNGEDMQYPADFPGVLSVSSVDSSMQKVENSASGENLDFVAPGECVYSTSLIGGYCAVSGTSIAAAHITGCAAVLLSRDTTKSSGFIRDLLIYSCKNLGSKFDFGYGIPDLKFALDNYDSFSANYNENNDYTAVNASPVDNFFNEDCYVDGQWSKDGHEGLAQYTSITDLQLIKKVSFQCDYPKYLKDISSNTGIVNPSNYKYKGSASYHGVGNYIATARLLYTIARYYKYGINYNANSFTPLLGLSEKTTGEKNINNIVNIDIPKMIHHFEATTNEKRSVIVMGMLFHLLGDVYAHRSIVPVSSIDYENRTEYGNGINGNEGLYFVVNDFEPDCGFHIFYDNYHIEEETTEKPVSSEDLINAISNVIESIGTEKIALRITELFKMFFYYIFNIPITVTYTHSKTLRGSQIVNDVELLQMAQNIPQYAANNLMCHISRGCFGALKRLAGLGVLQFKDIKYFLKNDNNYANAQRYYEDQAPGNEFYRRRYLVSGEAIGNVFTDLLSNSPFQPANLLPIYTPNLNQFYLKLDQLYNYLKDTNKILDTTTNSVLKYSYWSERTDSLFNYTTIISNGKYFIDPNTYETNHKPKYYTSVFPGGTGKTANSFYLT